MSPSFADFSRRRLGPQKQGQAGQEKYGSGVITPKSLVHGKRIPMGD